MTRVLVTGATGFVGQTLCGVLARDQATSFEQPCVIIVLRLLEFPRQPWWATLGRPLIGRAVLEGLDVVIHVAARAHVLHDSSANSNLYIETNVHGTERLADAAAQAGVRRFVLLSSIKVNGEETMEHAYTSDDEPRPRDAYGSSKWHAEERVRGVAKRSGMEAVIVRPPLVYGPGVRQIFSACCDGSTRNGPCH